jgi:hypothetical protein
VTKPARMEPAKVVVTQTPPACAAGQLVKDLHATIGESTVQRDTSSRALKR